MFVTNWRLKKHVKMHSNPRVKQCKYYKNDEHCPYDDLGCMFGHDLNTQVVDIIEQVKEYTNDIFNHEVQGDYSALKKYDSIMTNHVFKEIPIFTSTPKKSDKRHNCSTNNFSKCDD